jgi:hypothetical protein
MSSFIYGANGYFCGAPNRFCPNAALKNCPAVRHCSALSETLRKCREAAKAELK